MGASIVQAAAGIGKFGQGLYNSVVKGETPEPSPVAPPPDQPTPGNSQAALDEAARKQRQQSIGTKTIYSNQSGSGSLLSSGSTASRMMLGS